MQDIVQLGLVGCGGAGFPTHVKLSAKQVVHLIVNGAECEPLLHKDKEILRHHTDVFYHGLLTALSLTGARTAHIGVKQKYTDVLDRLSSSLPDNRIKLLPLSDFYPAGDEYELVYEATGQLIPFGGIPLHVGCVVLNVETILNLGRETAVTSKFLTLGGAVPNPMTVEVPIGISVREALALAGLHDLSGVAIIDGGPMMGRLLADPEREVVGKTCGGLLALPLQHPLIVRMMRPAAKNRAIARSACDQCTDCSELCPRALLGYPIRPHKTMRTAQLAPFDSQAYSRDSVFCSECGLCSLFSCPEDLPPREMCIEAKRLHLDNGVKPTAWAGQPTVHPLRQARRVGIDRLLKKLGLLDYAVDAPLVTPKLRPELVRLPRKMHLGMPVEPLVQVGETVTLGQPIGSIPPGKLGAALHASIAGRVTAIDDTAITLQRT